MHAYTHMHTQTHAHMYTYTLTHRSTHTHIQKAKQGLQQLFPPSDNTGMPGTTQTLETSAANPPGVGLVTRRRTVQISQVEVAEPKAPQRPHTT